MLTNQKSKTLTPLAIFLGVFLILPTTALGQAPSGAIGLSISPPNTEATANQGESVEKILILENSSSEPLPITLSVSNFTSSGEDGLADYQIGASEGLASWVTLSSSSITIDPRSSAEVPYTINVPDNASPGGHYATIFARLAPSGELSNSGSTVGVMMGANLLVNISGEIIEEAAIKEFSLPKTRFDEGDELPLVVRIANNGNTHIKPRGVVEIYRDGEKVKEVSLNPHGSNVLPNSTRKFEVNAGELSEDGRYTARLALSYGTTSQLLSQQSAPFLVVGKSTMNYLLMASGALLIAITAGAFMFKRKKDIPAALQDADSDQV